MENTQDLQARINKVWKKFTPEECMELICRGANGQHVYKDGKLDYILMGSKSIEYLRAYQKELLAKYETN